MLLLMTNPSLKATLKLDSCPQRTIGTGEIDELLELLVG